MGKKRNPKKIRTFKIQNDVWRNMLFVRLGGSGDQALKWFERKFGENPKPTVVAESNGSTIYDTGEKSHLIWFSEQKPSGSLVSHEALHSVKHVLTCSGLGPLTDETEEAYAYLLGWTVRQIGRKVW